MEETWQTKANGIPIGSNYDRFCYSNALTKLRKKMSALTQQIAILQHTKIKRAGAKPGLEQLWIRSLAPRGAYHRYSKQFGQELDDELSNCLEKSNALAKKIIHLEWSGFWSDKDVRPREKHDQLAEARKNARTAKKTLEKLNATSRRTLDFRNLSWLESIILATEQTAESQDYDYLNVLIYRFLQHLPNSQGMQNKFLLAVCHEIGAKRCIGRIVKARISRQLAHLIQVHNYLSQLEIDYPLSSYLQERVVLQELIQHVHAIDSQLEQKSASYDKRFFTVQEKLMQDTFQFSYRQMEILTQRRTIEAALDAEKRLVQWTLIEANKARKALTFFRDKLKLFERKLHSAKDADHKWQVANRFRTTIRTFIQSEDEFRSCIRSVRLKHEYITMTKGYENIGNSMSFESLKLYELLTPVLADLVKNSDSKMQRAGTATGVSKNQRAKLVREFESLSLYILAIIDHEITREIWIRKDRVDFLFLRSAFEAKLSQTVDSENNETSSFLTQVKSQLATSELLILEIRDAVQELQHIYQQLAAASMKAGHTDGLYPYERSLKSKRESFVSKLSELPREADITSYLIEIEQPLTRATQMLVNFESLHLNGQSDMETICCDLESVLQGDRSVIRDCLVDLLQCERELRSIANSIIDAETKQVALWTRRVELAEKRGNEVLRIRASKRKDIHEHFLLAFRPQAAPSPAPKLPLAFAEARQVVERVERKCGLVPELSIRENSEAFVLSLFDRILLLLEGLDEFSRY